MDGVGGGGRRRKSTASYNLHAHKQTHANLTVRFQKLCYFIFGITRQNYSSSFFFRSAHIHCHWYSLMLLLFRQTSKLLSSFKNLKCRYNSMYCQVEKRSLAVALWYILFVFRLLCFSLLFVASVLLVLLQSGGLVYSRMMSSTYDAHDTRADEGRCVLGSGGARREDYPRGTNEQTQTQKGTHFLFMLSLSFWPHSGWV